MRSLRKLILGETVAVPAGVALTVSVALGTHQLAGDSRWWTVGGGVLVLALVVGTLVVSLAPAVRRRG